ncbi:flagellar export protein FliJ [Virgibacillus sp. W0430]|uniref:flagellar export protein FliJ n=1 Tax=Virgibacillus sp. W0430 TaxID=3391580 RepID=UPI003F46CABD
MNLNTVLNVREKEKENAQIAHHHSQQAFEEVATKLYTLLKEKEMAEHSHESQLNTPMPIDQIKEQLAYINTLNAKIVELQKSVQKARADMEEKQILLTEAYIEVKKYEKVIENRVAEEKKLLLKNEQAMMDELSIQQYLGQNR